MRLSTTLVLLLLAGHLAAQTPPGPDPWAPTTELNSALPQWLRFDAEFRSLTPRKRIAP